MERNTRVVKVADLKIGGNNPIIIQSMTNTNSADVEATVKQINELEKAGCQLVRMTINNIKAAEAIKEIKKKVNLPLVADIHFDYRLALLAIENGIDKLRINPGNIGSDENVRKVVEAAKEKNIPIRIGVNSGSIEKEILEKYGKPCVDALVESAMYHVRLLEKFEFFDIIISLKSSNVKMMVEAYRKISSLVDYPLHLGVTEAGTKFQGTVKSAIGIGALLVDGIGDTLRVSLTENPVEEIKVAKEILKVLDLSDEGVEIISCPTCGRTEIDLIGLAKQVEEEFETEKNKLFNEMIKKKSVLTDEMIQFNGMEAADKKKQKSFRILMEMITEQHLKNIIYNSKIELYDITNISKNKANGTLELKFVDALDTLSKLKEYMIKKYGKNGQVDLDILLNEKIKSEISQYLDIYSKELIKNDKNVTEIMDIELKFELKGNEWIPKESISNYILKNFLENYKNN